MKRRKSDPAHSDPVKHADKRPLHHCILLFCVASALSSLWIRETCCLRAARLSPGALTNTVLSHLCERVKWSDPAGVWGVAASEK